MESRSDLPQPCLRTHRHLSSGLGLETVKALARNGAKVYLTSRNRQKGLDAIDRIKLAGLSPGNGQIELLELDLAAPKLAKAAAEEFLKREKRLDILVNNAAAHVSPRTLSAGRLLTKVQHDASVQNYA